MTALFNSLATEVFQILKGSGRTLSLFDKHGTKVYDPKDARRMFAEPDKMMVGINEDGSNSAVQMSISNTADLDDLVKIIDTLRNVSTRYNVLFNVRKYGKELSPKDFAFMAEPVTESLDSDSLFESMWGSMKTSYQQIGSTKLIVRHSAPVREFVGARGRNINQLFVETRQGERFRFPVINLSGARAFAQHLNQGGLPHDALSEQIVAMSREVGNLASISRHIHHNRNALAESAQNVRNTIRERLVDLRHSLSKIGRERGYAQYMESFSPTIETIQESENGTLDSECARLGELLDINSNHALAEALMPVALLTMGGNTMASDTNTAFKRSRITFENAEAADHFMENMSSEFGYGADKLVRESDHFVIDDYDVFENSQFFLDGAQGVSITEEPADKFTTYANKWTTDRLKKAGEPTVGGDAEKQAAALATGLKMLVAGRLDAKPQAGHMPKFSDKNAEISFKLGLLLEPKAGLHNDALFNYLSQLADSLAHGNPLSSNEQFFATRAAALVDKTVVRGESVDLLPEMQEMTEWFNTFDPAAVLEQDLSDDPSGLGDFQQRVAGELTQVNTSDHASMVNGDDVDEAYYDIAHKVAAQLAYADQEYNRDHGDEQVEPTDWYNQILDNWDAFTKLVDKHMGLAEGELDEMDRFSGEPDYSTVSDGTERKIWEVVDQEIHNALEGLVPSDFDDAAQMVDFVEDKLWGALKGWWDPTGDTEDKRAWDYLHSNDGRITQMVTHAVDAATDGAFNENISQEAIQDAGTLELTDEAVDADDEEFDGTAALNALTAKLSKAVADKLGDHPEGVSAEACMGAVMHVLTGEEVDILGGEAELLDLIQHERDYRIKHGIVGYEEVDECDIDPNDELEGANPMEPLPPAEDFVADVTHLDPKEPEDTAAGEAIPTDDDGLDRLRKLAGL
jgi:hypothetical protein